MQIFNNEKNYNLVIWCTKDASTLILIIFLFYN